MQAHGLLLQRHFGGVDQCRHDGKIAVDRSNLRWCSDGFELACDTGENVCIAFALDCCDRAKAKTFATLWSRPLTLGLAGQPRAADNDKGLPKADRDPSPMALE